MKTLYDVHIELREIEEEMDRLVLRKAKERNITERNRFDKEIDVLMARYLEMKHKLERISL